MKILIWNAQHLDNQSRALVSNAYKEKTEFLDKYLLSQNDEVDIVVLLETGKTGNTNKTLDAFFKGRTNSYELVTKLGQDDGFTKHTTLGINVYAKPEIARDLERMPYVLGDKERRGAVIVKYGNKLLAFYHANSSKKSFDHISSSIEFIQQQFSEDLVFFGGDLNYDYSAMPENLRRMEKLGHNGPGYTHTKIEYPISDELQEKLNRRYYSTIRRHGLERTFNSSYGNYRRELTYRQTHGIKKDYKLHAATMNKRLRAWDDKFEVAEEDFDFRYFVQKTPTREALVTRSFLDYALVDDVGDWSADCHGVTLQIGDDVLRYCNGLSMRSDHFPVIYTTHTL